MSRRAIVLVISILTALGFTAAAFFYDRYSVSEETPPVAPVASSLVRFHSPVIGTANAPVPSLSSSIRPARPAAPSFQ